MNTRLTIDLRNPQLMVLLRLEAARQEKALREIIVDALEGYFQNKSENQALLKLAEKSFEEWNHPKDAEYDRL